MHPDQPLDMPQFLFAQCLKCSNYVQEIIDISKYMHGHVYKCASCEKAINIYHSTVSSLTSNNHFLSSISSIFNERVRIFKITLEPNKAMPLDLSEHGIPTDASVTAINFTPGIGGLYPLLLQGNHITPSRFIPNTLHLYPISLNNAEDPPITTEVNVMVKWQPNSSTETSTQAIYDAAYYFEQGHYEKSIIPANLAAENAVKKLCYLWLKKFANKDETEKFLQDGATYSWQLKILLPMILSQINAHPLQHEIKGNLNKLRDYRNKIAHNGRLKTTLTKREIIELLVSSTFASQYLDELSSSL